MVSVAKCLTSKMVSNKTQRDQNMLSNEKNTIKNKTTERTRKCW